jgi:hypothetical protein
VRGDLIASASSDFASTVDLLREFLGNPWDRISAQVNETANSKSMPKLPAERNITDQDIENHTFMIFDEKNSREEMAAFSTAWEGSIEFQRSLGNLKLAKTAMMADEN